MAENKQYITHIQENGTVMISEDVIASIITLSVKEVEGVVSLSVKPGADIADIAVLVHSPRKLILNIFAVKRAVI